MTEVGSARSRIKAAYLMFLRDKPYNKIKVSEIVKAAGINRSTFYRSFDDVFALCNAVCEDIIADVLLDMQPDYRRSDLLQFVSAVSEKALNHKAEIKLVAGTNGNMQFVFCLRNSFLRHSNAIWKGLEGGTANTAILQPLPPIML